MNDARLFLPAVEVVDWLFPEVDISVGWLSFAASFFSSLMMASSRCSAVLTILRASEQSNLALKILGAASLCCPAAAGAGEIKQRAEIIGPAVKIRQ